MIENKIKEYRKIKNMTQMKLAGLLGVSRKTLSSIESGNVIPKVDIAYKLSFILGAPVQELFYNEEYSDFCLTKQGEWFENVADMYFKSKY